MKVGIDFEKLRNPHSGLGQFAYHLAKELAVLNPNETELTYYLPQTKQKEFGDAITYVNWQRYHHALGIPIQVDVWHSIHQEAKYFPRKAAKKLLTIHDLNFLQKYTGAKRQLALGRLQKLVNKMDGLAFISTYTQNECIKYLNLGQTQQRVIYNGLTIDEKAGTKKHPAVDDRPFLYTMGIISEKKNFHVLIEAMQHLPDLNLYIAGNNKSAYAQKIASTIADNGLQKQVKMLGEVSEEEKNWLYKNCSAFVFPSLAEGFGLPVIEALYYGKPVVTSNMTSLPEIGGGHTILLDNFESKNIADQVNYAISNQTGQKATAATAYAKSFTWKRAAQEYLNLYKTLV